MKISFVIPAYNEEKYIGHCLASIIADAQNTNFDYEIIVVNNASTDNTKSEVLKFTNVKILDEPKKGLCWARQKGYENAQGEFLACVDADIRMRAGWINDAIRAFEKNPNMVSFSGPYRYYDAPKFKGMILNALWKISAPVTYRILGYMILGGNYMVKKEALNKIGGYNTDIKFYGEDMELAKRLSQVGSVVFDMNFYNYSSSRRFIDQGLIRLCLKYAINLIWIILFSRPFNKGEVI